VNRSCQASYSGLEAPSFLSAAPLRFAVGVLVLPLSFGKSERRPFATGTFPSPFCAERPVVFCGWVIFDVVLFLCFYTGFDLVVRLPS